MSCCLSWLDILPLIVFYKLIKAVSSEPAFINFIVWSISDGIIVQFLNYSEIP